MPEYYVHRHRVTFDETNLVGNVYFAHFLHWQGHCREYFLADHAPEVVTALGEGLALVTVDCAADFFAEAHALDRIELRMALDRISEHRIVMSFDYVRTEPGPGELLARGRQTVACMRRAEGGLVPEPVPGQLRRALARYAPAASGAAA
ncbi:acyl-CoA thioesterase [Actinoplanes sp. LDG1-06]|uniref:Acyl-CoA thioesterase n=1 Tax=Paractinoplanes ovalisporus TaxID=2810368 RepID=A0ABS2A325_9ACTN|nr:acyl-CoA thioesterase [Actinoplanes ovalisporus]MBM2614214.1 acyl-CoA thioesterase [Actinoplanes ovalisporus]